MGNSLFPIRVLTLVNQLKQIPDVIEKHNSASIGPSAVLGNDDRTRLVLRSPFVARAVRKHYNVEAFRARFAYDETGYGNVPLLEVYSVEGELIAAPVKVNELNTDLADAIHIELLDLLLESKGLKLSLM